MPPKTRTNKASRTLKENTCILNTNELQKSDKVLKPPRRALADKTNSASDDNASLLTSDKQPAKTLSNKRSQGKNQINGERSRRVRRLPNRYKENYELKKLSSSPISPTKHSLGSKDASPVKKKPNVVIKVPVVVLSPLKIPVRIPDNTLIKNRPRRICKLPSKFDDHSISPSKFIPVQPINASTPLANKAKRINKGNVENTSGANNTRPPHKVSHVTPFKQKTLIDFFMKKSLADSNNNAKQKRRRPQNTLTKSPIKSRVKQTNTSVRVLEDNKKILKRDASNADIYEFTYDPEEEPPPAKKKKKKTLNKRPPKPKVTLKSNYDKNLAKALAALKNSVSSKPCTTPSEQQQSANEKANSLKPIIEYNKDIPTLESNTNHNESIINERNYNSVRVEDIALDMQVEEDDHNIDYSPVNSHCHPKTPAEPISNNQIVHRPNVNDPLNLGDDISFFDEQPAASSSMNVSTRHPLASPWRVEFGNLPIKWQVNTYVKPNMTPAVESSFISFNDTKKKHVYTNIVAEVNDSLTQVVENTPVLKQTSIMSFIKEVVEKSLNKKRKLKLTPVKSNSLFEDISNTPIIVKTHKKKSLLNSNPKSNSLTPDKDMTFSKTNNTIGISNESESSDVQEHDAQNAITPKKQKKNTVGNITYFGFNESENQENVWPKNKNNKARSLRSQAKGILQEHNIQKGPTRAIIPVAVKSNPIASSDIVNKMFDGMKSATEPPVFPEVAVNCHIETTNLAEPILPENLENEDSESVHLFEDIEFVHHHKPSRKSYSKPKKVGFSKTSAADNNSEPLSDIDQALSDEDLDDLSFRLPSMKLKKTIKKKINKKKLTKKEEKEVEAWAAGFNSMCEDIDEFDLVVE